MDRQTYIRTCRAASLQLKNKFTAPIDCPLLSAFNLKSSPVDGPHGSVDFCTVSHHDHQSVHPSSVIYVASSYSSLVVSYPACIVNLLLLQSHLLITFCCFSLLYDLGHVSLEIRDSDRQWTLRSQAVKGCVQCLAPPGWLGATAEHCPVCCESELRM